VTDLIKHISIPSVFPGKYSPCKKEGMESPVQYRPVPFPMII